MCRLIELSAQKIPSFRELRFKWTVFNAVRPDCHACCHAVWEIS